MLIDVYKEFSTVLSRLYENKNKWKIIALLYLISLFLSIILFFGGTRLHDYFEFHGKLIDAGTSPFKLEEERLKSNLQFIKRIHHLGYHYEMNSYDKLLSNLKGNGTTILFSSNPYLGILGVIRRLKQNQGLPIKYEVSNQNRNLLYPYLGSKEGFQKYFE